MTDEPDSDEHENGTPDEPRLIVREEPHRERHTNRWRSRASLRPTWLRLRSQRIIAYRRISQYLKPKFSWLFAIDANRVIALASIVTAVATGLYVYYASGQLKAIQGQLEQMKASSAQTDKLVIAAQTSASVSLDALNLARKNFLADERPYVFTNAVIPEPSSPRDAQGHFAAGSRLRGGSILITMDDPRQLTSLVTQGCFTAFVPSKRLTTTFNNYQPP